MCCKSVVKQIGLFLLFASHDICFFSLPSPPAPSPRLPLNGLFDAHAAILWLGPPPENKEVRQVEAEIFTGFNLGHTYSEILSFFLSFSFLFFSFLFSPFLSFPFPLYPAVL